MTLNELFARFDKLAAVSLPAYLLSSAPGPVPDPGGWLHLGCLRDSSVAKDPLSPRDRHCASVCPAGRSPLLRTGEGQSGCVGCGCVSSLLLHCHWSQESKWVSPASEAGGVARPHWEHCPGPRGVSVWAN